MSCHSYDLEMPSSCSTAERLSALVDAPMNCVQMAAAALARRQHSCGENSQYRAVQHKGKQKRQYIFAEPAADIG